MPDVVIAAYRRTAFTPARKGAFADTRPDELLAALLRAFVHELDIDPAAIEDVIVGCAIPEGEQGYNLARLAALRAGLPVSVAGVTVNRFCGSSMQAIHMACGAIATGAGEALLCAGVESMSRVPMQGFNLSPNPDLLREYPAAYMPMIETAENVAARWGISRAEQDAFALESHLRATRAVTGGGSSGEIVAIGPVDADGCIRSSTTIEALSNLTPPLGDGKTVTAGNASPLTDGAAVTLVCSLDFARAAGLTPLARIRAMAVAGCAADVMGIGPVPATAKALKRAGIKVANLDVVELNEAFAAQAIACIRELELDPQRVNPHGGAIALGHPMGATGARITGKAASLLNESGGHYALATQCIGGGQGIATILESLH